MAFTFERSQASEPKARKIFISHRHRDEAIATVLREHLLSWSIPDECIFQSSSYRNSGRLGYSINDEISSFLKETKLVILIYTYPDENWDYCMYECGLATNPATVKTNVIVFQCAQFQPRVFQHELLVTPDREGISRFTIQFHKDESFFPGLKAFKPELNDDGIRLLSDKLYQDLEKYLPRQRPGREIRWGHFTLSLPSNLNQCLREAESILASLDVAVSEHYSMQVLDAAGFGLRHFGYQNYEDGLNFQKLIDRWRSNISDMFPDNEIPEEHLVWLKELDLEICRSIRNEPPRLSWVPLKSAFQDIDWWVCPVINEILYKDDGSATLRVYMYRMDRIDNIEKNILQRKFSSEIS